jgi:ribosome-binding protein aMBF1 (putative translation factor)
MKKKKKPTATHDALTIMDRLFYDGKPKQQALLEQERANAAVARSIHELRTQAGLSQRELAERVGTTASVICRLEDADYQGHSLAMLHRIAAALHQRVEVRFVRIAKPRHSPAKRRMKRPTRTARR